MPISIKDKSPTPIIDNLLDKLNEVAVFFKVDLRALTIKSWQSLRIRMCKSNFPHTMGILNSR